MESTGEVASLSDRWSQLLCRTEVRMLLELALCEDLGSGDITTDSIFLQSVDAEARIVCRDQAVVCGLPLAREVFRRVDAGVTFEALVPEGSHVQPNTAVARLKGDIRGILKGERVALNFLMRLCGIANNSHRAAAAVPADCRAKIYDTRKTTPGWRYLEKMAVAVGGGRNHRVGLFDAILIKDNHIGVAGSVGEAIRRARAFAGDRYVLQVEIDGLHQLDEALQAGPDIILLDNFSLADLSEAVSRGPEGVEFEASGGITLDTIADVARTGVHRISLGALTHTVIPTDLGLDL